MKTIAFSVGFILAFTVGIRFMPLLPEPMKHMVAGLAIMFLVGVAFRHKIRKVFFRNRLSAADQSSSP